MGEVQLKLEIYVLQNLAKLREGRKNINVRDGKVGAK